MLNQLLSLTQPLFIIDTETTSLDVQTARICEIAFQQWDATGMVKEWSTRVNPGIPIPPEVTKIHGISDTDVVGRPLFKQIAASLAKGFSDCAFGGQNCRYDLRILDAEMRRVGQPWSYAGARVIDSKVLEALAEPRSLSHLYKKYTGQEHDGAHGALADVRASSVVIAAQLARYEALPRDIEQLHAAQWPGWIDSEGKFVFVNGVPCFSRWGKYGGRPMRDPEVNRPGRNGQTYWDFILTSDFSAEVKALASKAKLGEFPQ